MDFAYMFDGNTELAKHISYNTDNTFLMRRDKGSITFKCGGKQLQTDIPAGAPGGPGAIGVGVIASPGIGHTDVWNIEACRLTDANRVEKPLPADIPK